MFEKTTDGLPVLTYIILFETDRKAVPLNTSDAPYLQTKDAKWRWKRCRIVPRGYASLKLSRNLLRCLLSLSTQKSFWDQQAEFIYSSNEIR